MINVSGHRIGTAEVESALVAHPKVAEAAVVAYPHDIKGQAIYAYVTLNAGEEGDDALRPELKQQVRKEIGALAVPEKIHFTPALPKTGGSVPLPLLVPATAGRARHQPQER